MGQCASVTQHAIEAVSGAHKSSKSPVETEEAKVPCSAITPLAGPGLERCSARRPTAEAPIPPAQLSKPVPEAAPRQHLEHPGNISANTALTAVSEEPSERSSSSEASEQSSASEVTDSSSTEASESSSSEPSEHASREQQETAAPTAEPYYPDNPARVSTDEASYPGTPAAVSQPASPVAAVSEVASLATVCDSPTARPGATSESTASPEATSESTASPEATSEESNISSATTATPNSPASASAESAATSDSPVAPAAPPQVLKPGHSRHARRLSSDRLTMTAAIPRVKRRMSGGSGMKMFAAEMIPANPVVARVGEAPARVRKMGGMKRDDSWFVLGYDSNTSSQHYRNLTASGSRHNTANNTASMEDSWSGLALPSQHYIPKNTQLRKMKNDDLTVDSWAGMSIPSLYKNGGTDTESVFENSFATCTTRMSSGVDDDLLSLCESSMRDGSDSMNGSLTVTDGGVLSLGQQQQQQHRRAHSMDDSCMLLEDEGAVQPVQPPRRRSNSAGPEESASLIMQGQLA